jgi:hypothetical protein
MTLTKLTGAQGYIKVAGSLWADADFDFKLSTSPASHARTGKRSDIQYPGKLKVSISAKNIMRNGAYMGGEISSAATTGTDGTIKSGVALTADGFTASTTPSISTPSRVRLTCAALAIATGGTIEIMGTDADGTYISDPVAIGAIGIGEYVTSSKVFKTVTGVYVYGVRSASGTITVTSLAASSSYTVGTPKSYDLEFGGIDSVTGNYVKVFADNCWISGSGFGAGDANHVFEDAISFEMTDVDADLSIEELTTG